MSEHNPPSKRPSASKPAKAPQAEGGALDGLPTGFFDAALQQGSPCGGCGLLLKPGAVVCTSCGFHATTGQALRTKVVAAPKEKASRADADESPRRNPIAELGGFLNRMGPISIVIFAFLGALVGAGIWSAVAYSSHVDYKIVTILIGVCTGLGALLGSWGDRTVLSGMISVAFAVAAFFGARYYAATLFVEDEAKVVAAGIDKMTDEDFQAELAFEIAEKLEDSGKKLAWPKEMDLESAQKLKDYPKDVQKAVATQWADETWRNAWKAKRQSEIGAQFDSDKTEATSAIFNAMFSMGVLRWLIPTCLAAFFIGGSLE